MNNRKRPTNPALRNLLSTGMLLLLLVALVGLAQSVQAAVTTAPAGAQGTSHHFTAAAQSSVSALRDIKPIKPTGKNEVNPIEDRTITGQVNGVDTVIQNAFRVGPAANQPSAMPASTSFDGMDVIGGCGGCAPPDTDGEVGKNHYIQMVNSGFQIFNKAGTSLYGPAAINSLWSGLTDACAVQNSGDPVVLYDQLADRWVLTQFTSDTPYSECIAVSKTADPTGDYWLYDFNLGGSTLFWDYPHFGVWPDGYYMTANIFDDVSSRGAGIVAFQRATMLTGGTANGYCSGASSCDAVAGTNPMLPSDLDGPTAPPAGAPNYIFETPAGTTMHLRRASYTAAAGGGTFIGAPVNITVVAFTELCPATQNCVAQGGTTNKVDGIGDRLMFRAAYRNLGGIERVLLNHTVDAGSGKAGVRWYEIRNPNGTPSVFQQSTYAPDTASRWMGSLAMDKSGNIAVGFSASSSSVKPSIRYAGRLVSDPVSTLNQGEATMFTGGGAQTGTLHRWGDYSDMTVDPVDDCTFWYTQEYIPSDGSFNWNTRIGHFKFPTCGAAASTATPTRTRTKTPVPNATATRTATRTATAVAGCTAYTLRGDTSNSGHCSTTFTTNGGSTAGGWQFTQSLSAGVGVRSTSASGIGIYGISTSSIGTYGLSTSSYGGYMKSGSGYGGYAYTTSGLAAFRAHQNTLTAGHYGIISDGDVLINGNLTCTGSCLAALSVKTDSGDKLVYADSSTQNYISDQGAASLSSGRVTVKIDPAYAATVNLGKLYMVTVVPNSADTVGLAVVNKTATSFDVVELAKGSGNFSFDYRITALRKGFEGLRLGPAPLVPVDAPATDAP